MATSNGKRDRRESADVLQAKLVADRLQRQRAATEEIQAALARHRCQLAVSVTFRNMGVPQWAVDPVAE